MTSEALHASPSTGGSIGAPNYQRVASAIRQDIVDGRLVDGQRVTTTELAHQYGLSLAPIREALLQLAVEGVVLMHPKRGAVVRAVSAEFLTEIYEVRLGLIPYLEGERAALASEQDVSRMVLTELAFEQAARAGSVDAMIDLNSQFHRIPLSIRVNKEADQMLKRHHSLLQVVRRRYGFGPSHAGRAIEEHDMLIAAYRKGSKDEARRVSYLHLRHSFNELLEVMQTVRATGPAGRLGAA